MKHNISPLTHNGITLRLIQLQDMAKYYQDGFAVQDTESTYLTGSQDSYSQDAVDNFVTDSVASLERYLLLLIAPDGKIIGESVLNCIDYATRACNFRIIIWNGNYRNKGIGTWALQQTLHIAYNTLRLDRVELDVYSYNPRALAVYTNAGFVAVSTTDDAPPDINGNPAQEIHMTLDRHQWQQHQ